MKHFLSLFIALLPLYTWANSWQDPESKVNYTYTPGIGTASVCSSVNSSVSGSIKILEKLQIGGGVYFVTSIDYNAFYNASKLISVTIPNSVTSIGYYAFQNCSALTSINIPNSVTSIGLQAFQNCSSLTSINIPNSVTSIGNEDFKGCSSLTSINIPNSVTSIGEYNQEIKGETNVEIIPVSA